MSARVMVTQEVIEDLGLRMYGERDYNRWVVRMDRRRLQREMRRVRRTQLRRGVREGVNWWLMFWRMCRKYGVRA